MHLRTGVGVVELKVWRGQDSADGHWGCPIRERWGLLAHQRMSPALEDRLAFTVTATGSYEEAALLTEKWGCEVSASAIYALVQRLGQKAEEQTQARLQEAPQESQPQRGPTALAVLMLDGWQARFRGPGWAEEKTQAERVEWHEIKTGVFYRQEQAAQTQGGRGVISQKVLVRWQGEALELGRRLHWEAQREGLGRAQDSLVLGDGIPWIWNLAANRWPEARQLLDFYHGGQHMWSLGRACCGENTPQTEPWVERRMHRLRNGRERAVLKEIAGLKAPRGERGHAVRREQNYFAGHAGRMHYKEMADRGWPIGSGAVESACSGQQNRFKRRGQFWTQKGLRNLAALKSARENNHWDELWFAE